jgi:hypothetical protein
MLSRLPWTPAPETAAKPKPKLRRINRDRHRHLVETVANILRHGDPTKFALEAYSRHALRSGLCLKGWGWQEADAIAAEIVAAALNRIGARRPTWMEGQPEWTQDGVIVFERTRCIQCGWKLPEGHRKFCGPLCHAAFHAARSRDDDRMAANARIYAYYAEWSAKQEPQPCEQCETLFRPKRPGQRFCSKRCSNRNNAGLTIRRPT